MARSSPVLCFFSMLAFVVGCFPAAGPPVAPGPIDTKMASQLQAKIRSANGPIYSVDHQFKDEVFQANWELGNALSKSSQLQIKPSADWTQGEIYEAMQVVLADHTTKPWYGAIDDTILQLIPRAIANGETNSAADFAPDTPYDVSVVVKHHSSHWFVQVKTQIVDKDGNALGF